MYSQSELMHMYVQNPKGYIARPDLRSLARTVAGWSGDAVMQKSKTELVDIILAGQAKKEHETGFGAVTKAVERENVTEDKMPNTETEVKPEAAPAVVPPAVAAVGGAVDAEAALRGMINLVARSASKSIDATKIIADARTAAVDAARAEVLKIAPRRLEVVHDGKAVEVTGLKHKSLETVLKMTMALKTYCDGGAKGIYMAGPAGSGKTTIAAQVAKALDLKCYPKSVGPQTSMSDLGGYMNANGGYVRTVLREAYENGGVLLLDEIDAANAGVLTWLNALLANGHCSFPDGIVTMHKDFYCMAAGNTWGHGASSQYMGRNPLDAATLDRFCRIVISYDEKLEMDLTPETAKFTAKIQKLRAAAVVLGEKVVISPRASYHGGALVRGGLSEAAALDAVVYCGMNAEVKNRIVSEAGL